MKPLANCAILAVIVVVLAFAGARASEPAQTIPVAKAKGKTTVTYLFAYTESAKRESPNIVREVRRLIRWTNKAFKQSGTKVRLKMVKPLLVRGYNDKRRSESDSSRDLDSGRKLASVRKARDKRKADLVSFIRTTDEPLDTGICWSVSVTTTPSAMTAHLGVSVVQRLPTTACGPESFAQLVGTMMGLRRDRFIVGKAPKSQFNFGFVNVSAGIRTIMTSNAECDDRGKDCAIVQSFSTPRRNWKGEQIGIAEGQPGAADNARQLDINGPIIAAYR